MAHWLLVVPSDRYAAERLYYHDELEWPSRPSGGPGDGPVDGDDVVLAAGDPLVVFGLGTAAGRISGEVRIRYTHRLFDAPVALDGLSGPAGTATPLAETEFKSIAGRVGPEHAVTAPRRSWLVGVDLPIEAGSPAEAVRQFWSYVTRLGPRELPAFVSPADDELAMQAYVLGDVANLDPEEDE